MLLTLFAIRNAKPKQKPYKLSDGGGLHLLVQPNGGKHWRLRYRFAGKENMLALGTFPEVSLAKPAAPWFAQLRQPAYKQGCLIVSHHDVV